VDTDFMFVFYDVGKYVVKSACRRGNLFIDS